MTALQGFAPNLVGALLAILGANSRVLTESVAFKAQLYTVYIIYMIKIWGALWAKGMGQAVKLKWFSELFPRRGRLRTVG